MQESRTPTLFAPPLPPVAVPRSRSLIIGRSSECDLVIPSPRVSRNHARVRFQGEEIVLEDLGSTNGTAVNGIPVEGMQHLRLGDRIEIGGRTIHYCLVEEAPTETGSSDDTSVFDAEALRKELQEALRGDLNQLPIASVLQMLETTRQSGSLSIVTRNGTSMLWLEDGRPVHAETPGLAGPAAGFEICHYTEGRFLFEESQASAHRTLELSVTELLLEASRRRDEAEAPGLEEPVSEEPVYEEPPATGDPAEPPRPGEKTAKDPFKDWWVDDD